MYEWLILRKNICTFFLPLRRENYKVRVLLFQNNFFYCITKTQQQTLILYWF